MNSGMVGRRAPRTQCFVGHPQGPYGNAVVLMFRVERTGLGGWGPGLGFWCRLDRKGFGVWLVAYRFQDLGRWVEGCGSGWTVES